MSFCAIFAIMNITLTRHWADRDPFLRQRLAEEATIRASESRALTRGVAFAVNGHNNGATYEYKVSVCEATRHGRAAQKKGSIIRAVKQMRTAFS